jgi:hypothetical protein
MSAQSMEALRRGHEVKKSRAAFKRELKSGSVQLSPLLRDGIPDWLESLDAEHLLQLVPWIGFKRAHRLLADAHLGPMQQARHITTRQRNLLAEELEKIEGLR